MAWGNLTLTGNSDLVSSWHRHLNRGSGRNVEALKGLRNGCSWQVQQSIQRHWGGKEPGMFGKGEVGPCSQITDHEQCKMRQEKWGGSTEARETGREHTDLPWGGLLTYFAGSGKPWYSLEHRQHPEPRCQKAAEAARLSHRRSQSSSTGCDSAGTHVGPSSLRRPTEPCAFLSKGR